MREIRGGVSPAATLSLLTLGAEACLRVAQVNVVRAAAHVHTRPPAAAFNHNFPRFHLAGR